MPRIQYFYWCTTHETWVECTADEYMRLHYGKSFTKIQEIES